jgi:CBS domain-containing protein
MKAKEVKDVMTADPACCTPETSLQEVAKMMIDNDCGEIPVVKTKQNKIPIGVITDRDIVCRAIAEGLNPLELKARDCMSTPCLTVSPEMSVEECCQVLEQNQIRRVPVVDAGGACCGIVALADIALHAKKTAAEVVQEVSRPGAASGAS